MNPFARINLSSVLSSVCPPQPWRRKKPWRRGTLCVGESSSHPSRERGEGNVANHLRQGYGGQDVEVLPIPNPIASGLL
jgi:hypothetical protein